MALPFFILYSMPSVDTFGLLWSEGELESMIRLESLLRRGFFQLIDQSAAFI